METREPARVRKGHVRYAGCVLFVYGQTLFDAPLAFAVLMSAFISSILIGLVFHEVAHGYVANSLGDRTAALMGRLTLNPRAHLDPFGTAMIMLVGFGWAKPVPVNPMNTRDPKRSMALIASAGPATNLVMAGVAGIPIKLGWVPFFHPFISPSLVRFAAGLWTDSPENLLGLFLGTIVFINVLLAVFNFIPIPPLDGFRVAVGLLPDELSRPLARLEPWGFGILLVLLFVVPFMTGGEINPLFEITSPARRLFINLFAGVDLA